MKTREHERCGAEECVACQDCAFTYAAQHTMSTGSDEYACPVCDLADAEATIATLTAERDAARAEVERLRAQYEEPSDLETLAALDRGRALYPDEDDR